jgi:hypothetical protein
MPNFNCICKILDLTFRFKICLITHFAQNNHTQRHRRGPTHTGVRRQQIRSLHSRMCQQLHRNLQGPAHDRQAQHQPDISPHAHQLQLKLQLWPHARRQDLVQSSRHNSGRQATASIQPHQISECSPQRW